MKGDWFEFALIIRDTAERLAARPAEISDSQAARIERSVARELPPHMRGEFRKLLAQRLGRGYRGAYAQVARAIGDAIADEAAQQIKPAAHLRLVVDNSQEESGG